MNKCAKILSYVFWTVATGLYLASMLTNFWIDSPGRLVHSGLFQTCTSGNKCFPLNWQPNDGSLTTVIEGLLSGEIAVPMSIFITRILMLLAAAFVVLGILIGLCGVCTKNSCPTVAEGVLDILGGLIIVGACAYFTVQNADQNTPNFIQPSFHYSYYFAWISGGVYVIAGICGVMAGVTDTY